MATLLATNNRGCLNHILCNVLILTLTRVKELKIKLSNEVILLKPVVFSNLKTLEILLEELQSLWLEHEAALADLLLSKDGELACGIAQKIADLHCRIDEPGTMGFDVKKLLDDLAQFEELFLAVRNEEDDKLDVFKGGLINQLNRFNAIAKYQRAVKLLTERTEKQMLSPVVETSTVTS